MKTSTKSIPMFTTKDRSMKSCAHLILSCAVFGLALGMGAVAEGAVVDVALYELGEAGTIPGGLPQDSVGGHDFTNAIGGGATAITPGAFPGSTAAAPYTTNVGNFGTSGGTTVIPTDNVAIEIWARTSITAQTNKSLFTTGAPGNDATGAWAFNLDGGAWRVSRFNQTFFGGAVTAVANEWVNLAIIRSNGQTTFYVDGVAQGASDATAPVIDPATFHLGVNPGGSQYFIGDLDHLRIFTFDPNTDDAVAALSVNIPSPAALPAGLIGAAMVLVRRRRR